MEVLNKPTESKWITLQTRKITIAADVRKRGTSERGEWILFNFYRIDEKTTTGEKRGVYFDKGFIRPRFGKDLPHFEDDAYYILCLEEKTIANRENSEVKVVYTLIGEPEASIIEIIGKPE